MEGAKWKKETTRRSYYVTCPFSSSTTRKEVAAAVGGGRVQCIRCQIRRPENKLVELLRRRAGGCLTDGPCRSPPRRLLPKPNLAPPPLGARSWSPPRPTPCATSDHHGRVSGSSSISCAVLRKGRVAVDQRHAGERQSGSGDGLSHGFVFKARLTPMTKTGALALVLALAG
ncbi:hypothetical protein TIFTF001_013844 [Ficus carica]|uniref:Uncharacterized protein n=1 Tax=Ficus carica TaxID=3494 RepID=A0AA88D6E4_FICCA|nr:hypothetical protein TIFTF001_013844 [Ficus carica]